MGQGKRKKQRIDSYKSVAICIITFTLILLFIALCS
jgi:hypothetical protein